MDKNGGNIRVYEPIENFKRIHKSLIRNSDIDCLTLGIYVKIVEFGVTWKLNIKGLAKTLKLSDTKIRNAIGILEKEGYVKRVANYYDGKLHGWNYEVLPEPLDEKDRSKAGYKIGKESPFQCCAESSLTQNQTTLESDMTENKEDNNNKLNEYIDLIDNKTKGKKEIDKSISQKNDDLFEKCWIAYKRKGVKKTSKAQWERLSNEDKEKVLPHIRAYVSTREIRYQKDFERYLRDKLFNEVVYDKNQIIYDPVRCQEYMPNGFAIYPNEQDKCFYFVGNYSDGDKIFDGYDDSERPDGAQIVLNNGRGTLTWNKEQNKWIWKRR